MKSRLLTRLRQIARPDQFMMLLARGFAIIALGRLLLFGMHTMLGRHLGADEYGRLSFAMSVATILAVVFSMPNATIRYFSAYLGRADWPRLAGFMNRILVLMFGLGFIATLCLIGLGLAGPTGPEQRFGLLLAAPMVLPLSAAMWQVSVLRALRRLRESLVPFEIVVPMAVAGLVVALNLHRAIDAVAVLTAAYLGVTLLGSGWIARHLPPAARQAMPVHETREWLRVSATTATSALARTSLARWDVVVIGLLLDMTETGIYSAAARLSLIGSVVLRVIDVVTGPLIAEAFHTGRHDEVRDVLWRGIVVSAVAGLPIFGVMILFPDLLLALFGPQYAAGANLVRILAVGQLVNALTGPVNQALVLSRHESLHARTLLLVNLASICALFALVPWLGATGAALAATFSTILLNGLFFLYAWRLLLRPTPAEPLT